MFRQKLQKIIVCYLVLGTFNFRVSNLERMIAIFVDDLYSLNMEVNIFINSLQVFASSTTI